MAWLYVALEFGKQYSFQCRDRGSKRPGKGCIWLSAGPNSYTLDKIYCPYPTSLFPRSALYGSLFHTCGTTIAQVKVWLEAVLTVLTSSWGRTGVRLTFNTLCEKLHVCSMYIIMNSCEYFAIVANTLRNLWPIPGYIHTEVRIPQYFWSP